MSRLTCAQHTACPDSYVAWHEWAEKKARHFEQVRCGECDLYAIWRRKREATDD